jgi:ribulose-5-phosphate 4-epimerase/fuculose-1-phosphate aldolase
MLNASLEIAAEAHQTEEARIRRDLAACYRLIAHFDWDDLLSTHLSARIPGAIGSLLINPYGLLFEEITASSLIKVDMKTGAAHLATPYDVNPTGLAIHGAIYQARPDVGAAIHLHTRDGVAVSMLEEGLLPLNQTAMSIVPDIAYHEYEGIADQPGEGERLRRNLGAKNLMLMRNHGTLAVGRSVAEAFLRIYCLEWACTVQVRAQATGRPLHFASDDVVRAVGTRPDAVGTIADGPEQLAWRAVLRKMRRLDPSFEL